MTDKEKILAEIERLKETSLRCGAIGKNSRIIVLNEILSFIDSLSEEPVSEELEEAFRQSFEKVKEETMCVYDYHAGFVDGAKWQKEQMMAKAVDSSKLWKSADGSELPDIEREVIALTKDGHIVFAHRPPEWWDGKDIDTGKVTRRYPKRYGVGQWNIPDIKYWLDIQIPDIEQA